MQKPTVIKYSDYDFTTEETLIVGKDGRLEKSDWEYYEDHYPEKYNMESISGKVWVYKNKDILVAVIDGSIPKDKAESIFKCLQA